MKNAVKSIISAMVLITTLAYLSPVYAISNKETIYSKLDATGKNYKTIITTKEGEDIKQEESKKDLPLEVKITYTLDGKEIKAEDLAGKSGKVKIKIEYENKSAKQVTINGKTETMYTPFVVALGTIIDGKNNKNIKVTDGGRIVENGDKIVVVGMVFPGLDESLNLSGRLANIDIPDSIEITMDSTNFEMKNILTYATPKIFKEDINWSEFDDLFDKANELQNGINKIEDGANSLADGAETLEEGTVTLNAGASKLNNGANTLDSGIHILKQGTDSLNNGASTLNKGIEDLQEGLTSAGSGISNLKDGSSQVATGASQVDEGANSLKNGIDLLNTQSQELATGMVTISESIGELSDGAATIKGGLNKLAQELSGYADNLESIQALIDDDEALINSLDAETDVKTIEILNKNIQALEKEKTLLKGLSESSEISALVAGAKKLSDGLSALKEGTKDLPNKSKQLTGGIGTLAAGAKDLTHGTKSLSVGASSLNDGASTLVKGAKDLSDGTSKLVNGSKILADGTKAVNDGVDKLSKGSKTLTAGTKQLSDGTKNLVDGTKQLSDGSKELADGISKFNKDGIKKVSNFVNTDLRNVVTRGKQLEKLANDYNKFASDNEREDIGFISMVDSIKDERNNEDEKSN